MSLTTRFIRSIAVGAIAALALGMASPASATVFNFRMFDHPDGALAATQDYGLRLDHLNMFFSAETAADESRVTMVYDDVARTVSLTGTMRRNSDNTDWTLNYSFSNVTNGTLIGGLPNGTFPDFGAFDGVATLTNDLLTCDNCLPTEVITTINLGAKSRSGGLLFGLGSTGANNDEFDVERGGVPTATGWVMPNPTVDNTGCCNDFLLAAELFTPPVLNPVPVPAPIVMMGAVVVGLGLMARRRRFAA